jgi:hypothetical protein
VLNFPVFTGLVPVTQPAASAAEKEPFKAKGVDGGGSSDLTDVRSLDYRHRGGKDAVEKSAIPI